MKASIMPQLVRKDFLIVRKLILIFSLVSFVSIGVVSLLFGHIPNWVLVNIAFLLLVAPVVTSGIVVLMKTNVFEKEKSTQSFIMSLPVTVKEFTIAKLLVNLPIFTVMWLVISGISYYFCFGLGIFPLGSVPFITMIFLGIFVAYTCILSASLLFQSMGITILSIMLFEMGTSAYLWIVVFLEPIASHIYGPVAVWNATAITVIMLQLLVAFFMITSTFFIQNRKRDFI